MKYLQNIQSPSDLKKLKIEELEILADEIRQMIIETTSKNGGHLAASLGCVELAIALHYVLNANEDYLIWDVGHQAYAHKILTGRAGNFHTLRKFKGISGFPNRQESKYDIFTVGHSSTSIALALGLAKARDLQNKNSRIVAVIGDGALTSGLALEGLNNAANIKTKTRMTVILNDNEMSIAPNVGAISQYLNKLIANPRYNKYKEQLEEALYNLPRIGKITKIISKKIQESIKNLVVPKIIFEEFGFRYFGPIDGHNLNDMINLFDKILYYSGPKLIHIRTTKGKGYKYAEENPSYYHGLGPFDIDTGKLKSNAKISFTDVFGQTIINLAERNPKIFAITAAMPDGTGLTEFSQKFPDRFFDVGITEDFAVTFAAGLAAGGKKPIIAIYSTFLQRSIDQIYHDVALQRDIYPIFAIDRAGIVGADGPTHHGTLDLTYLLMIPNIVIMAPADEYDMVAMFKLAATLDMPCAIRYPRANIEGNKIPTLDEAQDLEFGAPQILNTGDKALILCVGPVARRAAKIISEKNISATVVNIRFVKPLNEQFLKTEIPKYDKIITIEENTIIGGFGAYINNFINANKFFGKQILNIGIPDRFIDAGEINEVYTTFEFDNDALFRRITDFLK